MNEETIEIVIHHSKAKSVHYNGAEYPTNTRVSLPWDDALKLSQNQFFNVDILHVNRKPYDPDFWNVNRAYGFSANADLATGFGGCTTNLIRQSIKNGYKVYWVGHTIDVKDLMHLSSKTTPSGIGMVWHEQPSAKWDTSPFSKNIGIVPFETTRIPASWVPRLNKLDALLVPCKQNVQMMRDSGVTIPIDIIYWGVDPKYFHPIPREDDGLFTFGTHGALSYRKGTDILVEAFRKAFPMYSFPDVRLICKTSKNVFPFMPQQDGKKIDNRISVIGTCEQEELEKKFFSKIDVGVYPFAGEGFGLCPLETMAVGRPVIITGWSGPMDYFKPEAGWTLDYKMVPAKSFTEKEYKEDCGEWAQPDINDLIEKMRYAYYHREEVKQKGDFAAQYVANEWTWDKKIHLYFEALDKYLTD